ncbi:MAG: response regulator [Armatimonadota bacterium]|nr:response regulator [Armatimonadota bacterium]MDR7533803.1 response regulator [Armatimonadota bacterium]MDR7536668.1 response regulator [Armatimonadota bacterium]
MPPLRVVIADDEALIRMGLRAMLTEAGYQVVGEAGDGQRTLDLIRKLDPDLVFLDIKMPPPDGLAVARQVMAAAPRPIILLSAYGDRDYVERAREAGVMAYLVKPIKEADLVPTIELALQHFRTQDALQGEIRSLEEALETRKLVERAKGVLMERDGLSELEAFRRIQRASRDERRPMKAIAQEILEGKR